MSAPEGFRKACLLAEVTEPGALRVEFDDMDVAIVRSGDVVYAIEDVCSHAEVALSEGEVEGNTIECWMHGSCFDLRSGAPTGPPATEPVDVFDVEVLGEVVYVKETARHTNGSRPNLAAILKQKEQAAS
ncbi:MAG: non-heme iron oxygenase ferredoxin subunit [Geodermatophilaceae bacterium]|nr:non-heme iron oxygenase ferredoxin subunit [Geodermatophilaceae bacterium]